MKINHKAKILALTFLMLSTSLISGCATTGANIEAVHTPDPLRINERIVFRDLTIPKSMDTTKKAVK